MNHSLRVIDTALRRARENLSLTAALAELHRERLIADTLRFQHFKPSAIIGRHQDLTREIVLEECIRRGVETARRMTGGGAIYMGPGLLGWELIIDRARTPGSLDDVSQQLCEGLAQGLSGLRIAARYRPRNDIEVDGRKISGTGGYMDGSTVVFQGTVLIDFDVADMAAVLRLPTAKLDRKRIGAIAERITSLRLLLGDVPPMDIVKQAVEDGLSGAIKATTYAGTLSEGEETLARKLFEAEIGCDSFVFGDQPPTTERAIAAGMATAGGFVEAVCKLREGEDGRIERAWITGDVFVTPPRAILDLEAALVGVPLAEAESFAAKFLEAQNVQIAGTTNTQFARVFELCWANYRNEKVKQGNS